MNIKDRMKQKENLAKSLCHINNDSFSDLTVNDYNNISPIYDEVMGEDISKIIFKIYMPILDKTKKSNSSFRLLDLACGTGSFIRKVARKYKKSVELFGIDLSRGQILEAKKRTNKKTSIKFSVGNIVECDYPKDINIITMNLDAMNHLRNPNHWKTLYKNVKESLQDGGLFLFDINTQKRLLEDFSYPEIIIKKDLTYVQCGLSGRIIGDFVARQHLMQIFSKTNNKIKEYRALIEHIAPPKKVLWKMLKKAGFLKIEEISILNVLRKKHIFLKNRIFVMAKI